MENFDILKKWRQFGQEKTFIEIGDILENEENWDIFGQVGQIQDILAVFWTF